MKRNANERECEGCESRAKEELARRAKAGIEDVQKYRRHGETEDDFLAWLYEQCPLCRTPLEWPWNRGCSECEWTNPYVLRESLATDSVNAVWICAYNRVATLVGRGIALNDAVLCVTMNMDAARTALQRRFPGIDGPPASANQPVAVLDLNDNGDLRKHPTIPQKPLDTV